MILSFIILTSVMLIIAGIIFGIPIILSIIVANEADKREKAIRNYLDECDEKLKKGEMSKEKMRTYIFTMNVKILA